MNGDFTLRRYILVLCFTVACFSGGTSLRAGEVISRGSSYPVYWGLPLMDQPFNGQAPRDVPSMSQSLSLTKDAYMALHTASASLFKSRAKPVPRVGEFFALAGFDFALSQLPFGESWLHEEWHRAVLGQYGISSHNGVYNFKFGDSIPVDRVRDEDLAYLKDHHPADMVRLSSAGMEAESEMALSLEKDLFFRGVLPRQNLLIATSHIDPISYRFTCSSSEADRETDDMNRKEASSIRDRDFTGLDCIAYVYDLFRPDEPYAARGAHPYGEGVNRYRKVSDLTHEERRYLNLMAYLGLLNLADPFMYFVDDWQSGPGRWNLTLRHHLAPFGHSLEQNIFFKREGEGYLVTLRQYFSHHRIGPGLQVERVGMQFAALGPAVSMDLWGGLWWQPHGQRFDSDVLAPGGVIGGRLRESMGERMATTLELEYKSQGWLAGRVALCPSFEARIGGEYAM